MSQFDASGVFIASIANLQIKQRNTIMWKPVIPGTHDELYDLVQDSIEAIGADFNKIYQASRSPKYAAELALYYAYLYRSFKEDRFFHQAIEMLNDAITNFDPASMSLALFDGIPDIAWTIEHVSSLLLRQDINPPSHEEDALREMDLLILKCQKKIPREKMVYDLISGQVGLGVYWLERRSSSCRALGIAEVLDSLRQLSTSSNRGTTWFTPPDLIPDTQKEIAPNGYFNLGIAHGIPGVIAFLSRVIAECPSEISQAQLLLTRAVEWLTSTQRPPTRNSLFSSWLHREEEEGTDSRLGWCYGDLGISACLQLASECTGIVSWRVIAKKILDFSITRRLDTCSIDDAGLCHGAFGVAHIYNRSFQRFGYAAHLDAARRWYAHGLRLRRPGIGIGGYYEWWRSDVPPERTNPSFLAGSIGVCLALLAAVSEQEPMWDRKLLLSRYIPTT